jgi:xanthine/CO dehydrogenase XdhC/CoxF family maturation factor
MNELARLLGAYDDCVATGKRVVLATVVSVTGSAYRRPGARMLVTDAGETFGTISGGCLERDVAERAAGVLATGKPARVVYDTRDDAAWGIGMGCNGEISILIEPLLTAGPMNPLNLLRMARDSGNDAAIAVIHRTEGSLAHQQWSYLVCGPDASFSEAEPSDHWAGNLYAAMQKALRERRSGAHSVSLPDGNAEIFIDFIPQPVELTIFGAGDDTQPIAGLADTLGWRVTVADHRPAWITRDRFPGATLFEAVAGDVPLKSSDFILVMNHNYETDKAVLRRLATLSTRYVGILGPRRRTERMLADLADEGVRPSAEILSSWHYPVGLDLGGETPAEVALSIVAEIQSVIGNRQGGRLRDRPGSIH